MLHLPGLLAAAQSDSGLHPAVRRAVTRMLQLVPVPKEWQVLAFDTYLALLAAPTEPVAFRANATTAAASLVKPYPKRAAGCS